MHIYIYDAFVNQKKFDNSSAKIERRITDLGLNGKIIRLSAMQSVHNIVEDEIKKGAKTIIAVGNSGILNQTINAVAKFSFLQNRTIQTPVGFIPVGKKNNQLTKYLGINSEEEACNILAARRIKKLDLGKANDLFFLIQASITTKDTTIKIDQDYTIEINEPGDINIINLPLFNNLPSEINSRADDGILELFIKTKSGKKYLTDKKLNKSVFSFKNLTIFNPKEAVTVDNSIQTPSPTLITIARQKINLIVGKKRFF